MPSAGSIARIGTNQSMLTGTSQPQAVEVQNLHINPSKVWVGESPSEPWAPLGRKLSGRGDPNTWSGINSFGTTGGTDP